MLESRSILHLDHPTSTHLDSDTAPRRAATVESTAAPPSARAVEIDSLQLLQGQRELCIRHGGEYYRLRHTRNDKLILTK